MGQAATAWSWVGDGRSPLAHHARGLPADGRRRAPRGAGIACLADATASAKPARSTLARRIARTSIVRGQVITAHLSISHTPARSALVPTITMRSPRKGRADEQPASMRAGPPMPPPPANLQSSRRDPSSTGPRSLVALGAREIGGRQEGDGEGEGESKRGMRHPYWGSWRGHSTLRHQRPPGSTRHPGAARPRTASRERGIIAPRGARNRNLACTGALNHGICRTTSSVFGRRRQDAWKGGGEEGKGTRAAKSPSSLRRRAHPALSGRSWSPSVCRRLVLSKPSSAP